MPNYNKSRCMNNIAPQNASDINFLLNGMSTELMTLFSEAVQWIQQGNMQKALDKFLAVTDVDIDDCDAESYFQFALRLAEAANNQQAVLYFRHLYENFNHDNSSAPIEKYEIKTKELPSDLLQTETNLFFYLDKLHQNRSRYLVFIVTGKNPWNGGLTVELSAKFEMLGLKISQCVEDGRAYVAFLAQGNVIFEKASPDVYTPIKATFQIGDQSVTLESYDDSKGKNKIELEGIDYATNTSGLSFVVFDQGVRDIIDVVSFDTASQDLTCYRETVWGYHRELLKWKNAHPEINIFSVKWPTFPTENISKLEQKILTIHPAVDVAVTHPEFPLRAFFNSQEEILEVTTPPKSYLDLSGARCFEDSHGKHVNIVSGHRITTDQPECGKRTIYFLGGCVIFGIGVSDEDTVASCLQRLCNKKNKDAQIIVENYGYYLLSALIPRNGEILRILNKIQFKAGDIVILDRGLDHADFTSNIPLLDLTKLSKRPHSHGEIFFDRYHLNKNGHRLVAERIYEYLQKTIFSKDNSTASHTQKLHKERTQLQIYKDELMSLYENRFSVGAIVMNCNPFTLGHRYLIEQACRQCAHLIIFVVEEDRSVFPFQDRFWLVKEGTKDLPNVVVMPSGQFILSSLTFSEYFNKSQLQNRVVDPSADINLFAKEIAPCLHITKRFVGTEPQDTVTNQYNMEMKNVFPKYGIDLIEIDRILQNDSGTIISASTVRKYIEERNLQAIQEIVPDITYQYIANHLESLIEKIRNLL